MWFVFDKLLILNIVYPFIAFCASLYWFTRFRATLPTIALTGSGLSLISIVLRFTNDAVYSQGVGSYLYPSEGQNAIVFWLYFHGINTGMTIFTVAIFLYFIQRGKSN